MAQDAARPAHGEAMADEERLVPLMIAYQAGRIDAFEALHLALADDVRRFFAASVLDPSAARDLAQQTFLELHRATTPTAAPGAPWVFGIAVNVRRRHRREAMARARRESDAPTVMAGVSGPPPDVVGTVAMQRALEQIPAGGGACVDPASRTGSASRRSARASASAPVRRSCDRAARCGLRALLAGDRRRDDE